MRNLLAFFLCYTLLAFGIELMIQLDGFWGGFWAGLCFGPGVWLLWNRGRL